MFAKPLSQERFDELNSEENGAPLFNRAIAAAYPTGSVFKPITAMASLEEGILTPTQTIFDDGEFKLGPQTFKNARDARYGLLNLSQALKVSSDVFFYTLGERANSRGPIIQRWARKLGLGHKTGIDIPGEFDGLLPDRRWRDAGYAKYQQVRQAREGAGRRRSRRCRSAAASSGRGPRATTSTSRSARATCRRRRCRWPSPTRRSPTAGAWCKPHLAMSVEDGLGRAVEEFRTTAKRHVKFSETNQATIMDGLRRAAGEADGTSADVFSGFAGGKLTVYGKTGTVERPGQPDQSWYAAYVPHPSRPIVVVVTVEKGGFGAETAAPAARLILSNWFDLGKDKFKQGDSATR